MLHNEKRRQHKHSATNITIALLLIYLSHHFHFLFIYICTLLKIKQLFTKKNLTILSKPTGPDQDLKVSEPTVRCSLLVNGDHRRVIQVVSVE